MLPGFYLVFFCGIFCSVCVRPDRPVRHRLRGALRRHSGRSHRIVAHQILRKCKSFLGSLFRVFNSIFFSLFPPKPRLTNPFSGVVTPKWKFCGGPITPEVIENQFIAMPLQILEGVCENLLGVIYPLWQCFPILGYFTPRG